MSKRYRSTSRWSTPVGGLFLFEYRPTHLTNIGDVSCWDNPPIVGRLLAMTRRNLVHQTRNAMVHLPSLKMQSELAQLAHVMSQSFALRPDYEQIKLAFHDFVQDLLGLKVIGCLQVMKACEDF